MTLVVHSLSHTNHAFVLISIQTHLPVSYFTEGSVEEYISSFGDTVTP